MCTAEIIQLYFLFIFAALSRTPSAVVADPSLGNSASEHLMQGAPLLLSLKKLLKVDLRSFSKFLVFTNVGRDPRATVLTE